MNLRIVLAYLNGVRYGNAVEYCELFCLKIYLKSLCCFVSRSELE